MILLAQQSSAPVVPLGAVAVGVFAVLVLVALSLVLVRVVRRFL